MAMLLRRHAIPSSCCQLLQETLTQRLYEASFSPSSSPFSSCSGNRDVSRNITELGRHPVVTPHSSRRKTEFWRPELGDWMMRNSHSGGQNEEVEAPAQEKSVASGKLVLYRAKWIRPIRLLVRFKLLQLGGVIALAIPLAEYSQQGSLSLGTTLAVGAVVGGAGAASTALWYYSRRLVGEISLLLPDLRIVQISVLDFWGNREDLRYDISHIVPPLKRMTNEELQSAANKVMIPLDVIGDRQFFLSLRHGYLVHKDLLFSLLNGSIEARDVCKRAV